MKTPWMLDCIMGADGKLPKLSLRVLEIVSAYLWGRGSRRHPGCGAIRPVMWVYAVLLISGVSPAGLELWFLFVFSFVVLWGRWLQSLGVVRSREGTELCGGWKCVCAWDKVFPCCEGIEVACGCHKKWWPCCLAAGKIFSLNRCQLWLLTWGTLM